MDYIGTIIFADQSRAEFTAAAECHDGVTAVYADYSGDKKIFEDRGAEIMIPTEGFGAYMADYRYCEFWCTPYFGEDYTKIPMETQLLLYRRGEKWGVIFPVVSEQYKCVLSGTENGLAAVMFSWYSELNDVKGLAFVTAEGDDPYVLVEKCAKTALKLLNNGCVPRDCRRYPEIFEYLGWCSWDAMPIGVNEAGIIEKCEEFKAKNIPVKWAIFDDMWAEVRPFRASCTREELFQNHRSPLYDFEAGYDRFPNGLKSAVDKVKAYGMEVGIWLPTTGYWNGLESGSPADKLCEGTTIPAINGFIIGDWREEKSFGYYNRVHRFYKDCGAAFMKVDNQTMVKRFYKGMDSVGRIASEYHRGLEASIGVNFDNTMITCMGMGSEDMWNRSYSSISRCSDDFQPENRPWFIHHILQCTYNSLMQGQFYWNDYDMWWTDDTQGEKNSLLRAVSGGPIYVSDAIGRSRADILKPLAFADGRILRCERSGMPTADCLAVDPVKSDKPLKIQNIVGKSGVVAAFNITEKQENVTGTVKPSDVYGISGDKFVVYEHFTGEYRIAGYEEAVEFSLRDVDDYRLFVIVPYLNNFAAIGLIDKFISPASITAQIGEAVTLYESGRYAYVKDGRLVVEER